MSSPVVYILHVGNWRQPRAFQNACTAAAAASEAVIDGADSIGMAPDFLGPDFQRLYNGATMDGGLQPEEVTDLLTLWNDHWSRESGMQVTLERVQLEL